MFNTRRLKFDSDGYIRQAPPQGDIKPRSKLHKYDKKGRPCSIDDPRVIEFCLNCKRAQCRYGYCDELRDYARKLGLHVER